MVSTESEDELHCFAKRMGLQRDWFQAHDKHPHYDLTTSRAKVRAEVAGAVRVSPKELIELAWWKKQ